MIKEERLHNITESLAEAKMKLSKTRLPKHIYDEIYGLIEKARKEAWELKREQSWVQ